MSVLIRIGLLSHTSSLRTAQTRARTEERQRTQKRAQARTIHPKARSHTLAVSCTRTYTSTCPRAHASTHTGKQTATLARPLRARLHTRARSHKPPPPPPPNTHTSLTRTGSAELRRLPKRFLGPCAPRSPRARPLQPALNFAAAAGDVAAVRLEVPDTAASAAASRPTAQS